MLYMVICKVNNVEYMTKIKAESNSGAEHAILDLSYCGHHDYGVTACQAFTAKEMKTDCFIGMALSANPIDVETLTRIIEEHNEELRKRDAAEDEIRAIKKQMSELEDRLNKAQAILNSK